MIALVAVDAKFLTARTPGPFIFPHQLQPWLCSFCGCQASLVRTLPPKFAIEWKMQYNQPACRPRASGVVSEAHWRFESVAMVVILLRARMPEVFADAPAPCFLLDLRVGTASTKRIWSSLP